MSFREFVNSERYWFCLALVNITGMFLGMVAGSPPIVISNGVMCLISCYLFYRGI